MSTLPENNTINGVTDFHTHAFPDGLAERAMGTLVEKTGGEKPYHDGRVSSLINSMDRAGIKRSVVCSIATRPAQFEHILGWSREIRSDRIVPFPSFHPSDPDFKDRIRAIKAEGFRGVKLHPYYQDFVLDDDSMMPIYEGLHEAGLIIVMHTGFDIAFDRIRKADPQRILNVIERFPGIRLVTTHLGGWEQWDEVEDLLIGKEIWMEISFALQLMGPERTKELILRHPAGYLLFGTDSPWTGQSESMGLFNQMGLETDLREAVLSANAARLLGPA